MNFKNRIKKIISNLNTNSELKKSNWGRNYGWFIEFEKNKIGELVEVKNIDMFWFEYKIIPYNGFEKIVLNFENWEQGRFKYQNKFYLQYANQAFCGGSGILNENQTYMISMRALHLNSIE